MSAQTQTVSQLTLLKVASNTSKCQVFCEINSSLQKYQIPVDDQTSVENIINECILQIKKARKALGLGFDFVFCELYASRKNGKKISDLPSLQSQQKILKTGLKSFYLQYDQKSQKKTNFCSVSTKSIQSEMKIERRQVKEFKASNQFGCFCFA